MVAAYRREKNFNPVEILKNGKSGDTRRPALPRGTARCVKNRCAAPRAEAWHRVKRAAPRMATKAAPRAGV